MFGRIIIKLSTLTSPLHHYLKFAEQSGPLPHQSESSFAYLVAQQLSLLETKEDLGGFSFGNSIVPSKQPSFAGRVWDLKRLVSRDLCRGLWAGNMLTCGPAHPSHQDPPEMLAELRLDLGALERDFFGQWDGREYLLLQLPDVDFSKGTNNLTTKVILALPSICQLPL